MPLSQAALYEKLSATAADDDEERYNVDFLRKGMLSDEAPGLQDGGRSSQPADTAFDALGGGGVSTADPVATDTMHVDCAVPQRHG